MMNFLPPNFSVQVFKAVKKQKNPGGAWTISRGKLGAVFNTIKIFRTVLLLL